jgi:hypothetical protein
MEHIYLDIREQHDLIFQKYKQRLFVHQRRFSYSVMGLNLVLPICMGLSFGEVAKARLTL